MDRASLQELLLHNVCELTFTRRRPVKGRPMQRKMLCTNSTSLLKSTDGLFVLHFSEPTKSPSVDLIKANLVVTWDIMMQEFRNIPPESCHILRKWEDNDKFWTFFKAEIYPMSPGDKIFYMDT